MMYKIIQSITSIVLVCFVSTYVIGGTLANEDVKSEMYLFTYDEYAGPANENGISNPNAGEIFKMAIKVYYKGEQIKDLKIIQPGDFEVVKSYVDYGLIPAIWTNIFILKSPRKPSNYMCRFEGISKDGTKFIYEKEIDIAEKGVEINIGNFGCVVWTLLGIAVLGSVLLKK